MDLNSDKGPDFSDLEKLLNYFFNHKVDLEKYRIKKNKHKKPAFENPKLQKLHEVK